MPRPRKDGTLQLGLPLMTQSEKVEARAYFEASTGRHLGRHRRRRDQLGINDKPRGRIAEAEARGRDKASRHLPVSE